MITKKVRLSPTRIKDTKVEFVLMTQKQYKKFNVDIDSKKDAQILYDLLCEQVPSSTYVELYKLFRERL